MVLSSQHHISMLATLHQPTTSVILTNHIKFLNLIIQICNVFLEILKVSVLLYFLSLTVSFSSENPKQVQPLKFQSDWLAIGRSRSVD